MCEENPCILEITRIKTTTLRTVGVGNECRIHLSCIEEMLPSTGKVVFLFYRLAVSTPTEVDIEVSFHMDREEALQAFKDQVHIVYYLQPK